MSFKVMFAMPWGTSEFPVSRNVSALHVSFFFCFSLWSFWFLYF